MATKDPASMMSVTVNVYSELLMDAAEWWIMTKKLDHFEKALKIKEMVQSL